MRLRKNISLRKLVGHDEKKELINTIKTVLINYPINVIRIIRIIKISGKLAQSGMDPIDILAKEYLRRKHFQKDSKCQ